MLATFTSKGCLQRLHVQFRHTKTFDGIIFGQHVCIFRNASFDEQILNTCSYIYFLFFIFLFFYFFGFLYCQAVCGDQIEEKTHDLKKKNR